MNDPGSTEVDFSEKRKKKNTVLKREETKIWSWLGGRVERWCPLTWREGNIICCIAKFFFITIKSSCIHSPFLVTAQSSSSAFFLARPRNCNTFEIETHALQNLFSTCCEKICRKSIFPDNHSPIDVKTSIALLTKQENKQLNSCEILNILFPRQNKQNKNQGSIFN